MPRTVWTKLQSDPNGTWSRHEGEPPFSITALPERVYDVLTDTGENFVITPLQAMAPSEISAVQVGPNTISMTSSVAGTCYYGWYPDGVDAGLINISDMIAGTDAAQIANGTAGFFAAAGILDDSDIPFTGLSGNTLYQLVFVVDIEDAGNYTNLASVMITTPSDMIAPTVSSATTNVAGNTLILTLSETVAGTEATGDWAVNDVTGGSATVDSVTISGGTITLELSGNLIQTGDTPTVDYSAGDIADAAGNDLASFADQAVTNNVPAASVAVTYLDTYTNTADVGGSTFTFSGVDIGTPAAGREVYVVAQARSRGVTSMTIAGEVDASPIRNNNSNVATSIGRATVATGTTATIVVEFEFPVTLPEGARIAVFEVIGRTSEIASYIVDNQSAPNLNTWNVQAGDAIIGGVGEEGAATLAVTNLTQRGTLYDYDSNDEGGFWGDDSLVANASFTTEISGGTRNSACLVQLR